MFLTKTVKIVRTNFVDISLIFKCNKPLFEKKKKDKHMPLQLFSCGRSGIVLVEN